MIAGELRPHHMYRLFDADQRLLYVGVTRDLCRRLREHRKAAPWWADVASATTEVYPNWFAVRQAERATIADENPKHNRDRALRDTDHSARSARRVTKQKGYRALPETPVDLHGYLSVPDSARKSPQPALRARITHARMATNQKNPKIGHCGHCDHCQAIPNPGGAA
jgi:predicted GIY-YIG superfamily endonuclease